MRAFGPPNEGNMKNQRNPTFSGCTFSNVNVRFPHKSEIAFWNAKSYVNGAFSRIRNFHMAPGNDRRDFCGPRSLSSARMGPEPIIISAFSCHFCVVNFAKSEKRWSLRRRRTNVPPLDHGQSFLKIGKSSIYMVYFSRAAGALKIAK